MNREDIIRMAREAGFVVDEKAQQYQPNCIFHTHHMVDELLGRFAAFVFEAATEEANRRANASWAHMCEKMVAAEREACAKVCEDMNSELSPEIAAAIRARGKA